MGRSPVQLERQRAQPMAWSDIANWDKARDHCVQKTFQNETIFCVALAFATYFY